jgi:hypothetical protein
MSNLLTILNRHLLFMFIAFAVPLPATGTDCPPLSEGINSRISNYLSRRLVSSDSVVVSVVSVSSVTGTCYHKVVVSIPGAAAPVQFYLSPDERFLTSALLDLKVDPEQEVARICVERGGAVGPGCHSAQGGATQAHNARGIRRLPMSLLPAIRGVV